LTCDDNVNKTKVRKRRRNNSGKFNDLNFLLWFVCLAENRQTKASTKALLNNLMTSLTVKRIAYLRHFVNKKVAILLSADFL